MLRWPGNRSRGSAFAAPANALTVSRRARPPEHLPGAEHMAGAKHLAGAEHMAGAKHLPGSEHLPAF